MNTTTSKNPSPCRQASESTLGDINGENLSELQPKWKRRFERGTPEHALTWNTRRQRSKRLFEWQLAVMAKFATSHRALRVAWLLQSLCLKDGYTYATDAYISKALGIELNNLQKTLATREKAGAIVRASHFVDGKPQRRIWPSTQIIPVTVTGIHTRHGDAGIPVTVTGEIHYNSRTRPSFTQIAARRTAQLRGTKGRTGAPRVRNHT